jgi:hypothetical protein
MNLSLFLAFTVFILASASSFAICPTIPIQAFDKQRGFVDIQAYQDDKTGTTRFSITTKPATFFSHFQHGFPKERATARVTLKSLNTDHFKGVTVDLARMNYADPDLTVSFEVPSTDLEHYELEFDCSITWGKGDIPVIGGEIHTATLKAYRNAKETVTETNPIWDELRKQHEAMLKAGSFGSSSRNADLQQKTEQDGTGQPATRPKSKSEGSDKPQPEAESRSR